MARYVTLLVLFWVVSFCNADELVSKKYFGYKMGVLHYLADNKIKNDNPSKDFLAEWNPVNTPSASKLLQPGFKIIFWGSAEGCDLKSDGGPVTNVGNPIFKKTNALTGIELDKKRSNLIWSPSGNSKNCRTEMRNEVGSSFVVINEDLKSGGIGLYTQTGSEYDKKGKPFWRQFGAEGQNLHGANKFIQGTFVAFRFDWKNDETVHPWDGNTNKQNDALKVVIRATQSVASYEIESVGLNKNTPTQVNQHFGVSFVNTNCQEKKTKSSICQIKYVFHSALMRRGVSDWSNEKWFDSATLLLDPAQGGMPVFFGPIKSKGEKTTAKANKAIDLWQSNGIESQHTTFSMSPFEVSISFDQLKSALKLVSAKMAGIPFERIDDEAVKKYFGVSWFEPSAWSLIDFNIAQEVHNEEYDKLAYIGGGFKELSVEAVP